MPGHNREGKRGEKESRVNKKTLLNKLCQALAQVNNIPYIGN